MQLDRYLDERNIPNAEFAERIGVTRMAVGRYRAGARMPAPEIAVRIEKATRGHVTVGDLHTAHLDWRRRHPGAAPDGDATPADPPAA